jgi:hypothetical protein
MPRPTPPSGPWATLLRVAWLAIALGLLLQLALLLVAAGYGKDISPRPLLAETFRTVSWSLLVCVGVALGHMGVGLMVGVVFGGVFLAVVVQSAPIPLSASALLARGVNELLFPSAARWWSSLPRSSELTSIPQQRIGP